MFFLFLNYPGYSLRMSGHFFLSDVRGKGNSGPRRVLAEKGKARCLRKIDHFK